MSDVTAAAHAGGGVEQLSPAARSTDSTFTGSLGFREYSILVAVATFVTTFGQTKVLGQFPTTFLLKEHFGFSKEQVALFLFWVTFHWYVKPLVGILTDGFPLFGTRRRHYMLLGAAGMFVCWTAMIVVWPSYPALLTAMVAMNIAVIVSSTVLGGLMVEAGHSFGASGRMASLRQLLQNVSYIAAPALGGYLAERAYGWTAGIAAASGLALFACAFLVLREPRAQPVAASVRTTASARPRLPPALAVGVLVLLALATGLLAVEELRGLAYSLYGLVVALGAVIVLAVVPTSNPTVAGAQAQLGQIFSSRPLWLALAMLFLFYMVPGFSTALIYQQSDVMKFDKTFIGLLGSIEGIGGVVAAFGYLWLCRKMSLRVLLVAAIALAALSTYLYVFYSARTAPFTHALYGSNAGFALVLVELAMMDLCIRSTPRGCEALGFALLMSDRNFALGMNDVLGSSLMDQYHIRFSSLIVFNATTTLLMLLFVPVLPASLVGWREKA